MTCMVNGREDVVKGASTPAVFKRTKDKLWPLNVAQPVEVLGFEWSRIKRVYSFVFNVT